MSGGARHSRRAADGSRPEPAASEWKRPVCVVLHAHLPYVKVDGTGRTLEERWFGEAMADVYWPLLELLERLASDGIPYRLGLSVTPTLLAMLEDAEMDALALRMLEKRAELARLELRRLRRHPQLAATALLYARRYARLRRYAARIGGGRGWLARLRLLAEAGCLELLAGVGTHPFLPLVATKEARFAQLAAGRAEHVRVFGMEPQGVWLPECGYAPELDTLLQRLGYMFTVAQPGQPGDSAEHAGVLRTKGGIVMLLRDAEASAHVWDASRGYPGHEHYRDYYEDIGYELGREDAAEWAYLRPYLLPDGTRIATGMKYARVTDRRAARKQPYERERALGAVRRHAQDWLARLAERAKAGADAWADADSGMNDLGAAAEAAPAGAGKTFAREAGPGPIVCAFDAELFGHWWFEGPEFLEALFREAAREGALPPLRWAAPSEALAACRAETLPATPTGALSSWGRGGYADVWLQPRTDAMVPLLHAAEERLVRAADEAAREPGAAEPSEAAGARRAVLEAAARELMLAQSSDWAFLIDAGTMPAYALRRFKGHLDRFHRLLDGAQPAAGAPALLPELRIEWYRSLRDDGLGLRRKDAAAAAAAQAAPAAGSRRCRVLMLTWEYPPHIVGGLGKAVGDLARELAAQGHEVHVITRAEHTAETGVFDGVCVHRVPVLRSLRSVPFLKWVFQMNVAFAGRAAELMALGLRFDVLHAHDWLVCAAAAELAGGGLPLVATMHATEHGRRAGRLDGPVSPRLHAWEARLAAAADEVIVCSESMRAELAHLFAARPHVIPCGHAASAAPPAAPGGADALALPPRGSGAAVLAFLGRLVPEKGVQVLLRALPHLHARFPALTLVIAGEGPLRPELEAQAASLGDCVRFAGFLAEPAKSALFARADLCVVPSLYEPFGLVALEAMAAGTPLLASDVGGLADIVTDGVDGLKFPPGDAAALAARAAGSLGDPLAAEARAAAAQRTVRERYSLPPIAAATARVYERAIRKQRGTL